MEDERNLAEDLNVEKLFAEDNHLVYTVGELKKWIEAHSIPDEAVIVVERVEDKYYADGWKTIKKATFPPEYISEYTQVFSAAKYSSHKLDKKILYLDLHY